jgi:hypothetical protein
MPFMISRYNGTCKTCSGSFSRGEEIYYAGKGSVYHASCYRGKTKPDDKPSTLPGGKPFTLDRETRFLIDFPELQEFCLSAFKNDYKVSQRGNRATVDYYTNQLGIRGCRESFTGYSQAQAVDWLENGYESDALNDILESTPIREKRKFIYAEEGDEIDLSAAWSGEDNFMGQWTTRETIPGVSLEFRYCFVSTTNAKVINEYLAWLAQTVAALEVSGIDPEISVSVAGRLYWSHNEQGRVMIRVKREGETVDFRSWSAMLSPAGYRTCGFMATVLMGDSMGKTVDTGISGSSNDADSWGVEVEPEQGHIRVNVPWHPHHFPAEEMTRKFHDAIMQLK